MSWRNHEVIVGVTHCRNGCKVRSTVFESQARPTGMRRQRACPQCNVTWVTYEVRESDMVALAEAKKVKLKTRAKEARDKRMRTYFKRENE